MSSLATPSPSLSLKSARNAVLEWLRESHRNPMFLAGHTERKLDVESVRIVERFMSWVIPAGFKATMETVEGAAGCGFRVHWTYLDSELVVGKRPAAAATEEEARLLGAAFLVQNEWCRLRLT